MTFFWISLRNLFCSPELIAGACSPELTALPVPPCLPISLEAQGEGRGERGEGEREGRGDQVLVGVCRRQGSAEGQRKSGGVLFSSWRNLLEKLLVDLLENLEGY